MLNFFDRVHAEMLLEVEVGVDWFLSEIAAWSSGIGDFGLTRNSWLRVLQRRRIKSIVHILPISIHLPRVWIFDTRGIKKITYRGTLRSVRCHLMAESKIRIRA